MTLQQPIRSNFRQSWFVDVLFVVLLNRSMCISLQVAVCQFCKIFFLFFCQCGPTLNVPVDLHLSNLLTGMKRILPMQLEYSPV